MGKEESQAVCHTADLYSPKSKAATCSDTHSLHISAFWLCTLPGCSAPMPGWYFSALAMLMSAGFCLYLAQAAPLTEQKLVLAVTVFS